MPDLPLLVAIAVSIVAFLLLNLGRGERRRRGRRPHSPPRLHVISSAPARVGRGADPLDQLRVVMGATYEKRRLLSRSEAKVFYAAERAIRDLKLNWRVMAQVSLGEVLSSPDDDAFHAINAKRVDMLVVTSGGEPIAAIEYQGAGHYQGNAPARDAVKKEALRRAGVGYIEITAAHGPADIAHEIARLNGAAKASPKPRAVENRV